VIRKRFELLTHALEGRCSIQLSYQTNPALFLKRCKSSSNFGKMQLFWLKLGESTDYLAKIR